MSTNLPQPAAIDVESVEATVVIDVAAGTARADATVSFTAAPGPIAFDLRQEIDAERYPSTDLGGGPGAEMRVFTPGAGPQRLALQYALGPPAVDLALPLRWEPDGVWWDVWMSDLVPGRYLEQWLPVGLCGDRFGLSLRIQLVGTKRPHVVVTNGSVQTNGPNDYLLTFPPEFTSLSPLWWVAPADHVDWVRKVPGEVDVTVAAPLALGHDLREVAAMIDAHLALNTRAIGAYAFGERPFTCVLWEHSRAMEYDGGCSTSLDSLEHEAFHSWIGRGVKPASQNDGWIDEAITPG